MDIEESLSQKVSSKELVSSRRHWMVTTTAAIAGLAFDPNAFAVTASDVGATNATAGGARAFGEGAARAVTDDGVSRTAEAIHQETVFKASPKRIYEALTDPEQFQKVELLSMDLKSSDLAKNPAQISREVGGAFSIFGAYIVGRQIELVPNQRIVQAWRVTNWSTGIYSIARFELAEQGSGTKIIFDHTGFPVGYGEHLAAGWKAHYWESLERFLA